MFQHSGWVVLAATVMMVNPVSSAAQTASSLPAPYQVEAVVQRADGDDSGRGLGRPRVMIDLGTAEGEPWPDRSRPRMLTIIGNEGAIAASLEDVVKVCETLCGDEAEECHYEGVLVPAGSLATIGTPVAALSGEHTLSDFAAIDDSASGAADPVALSEAFETAIWPDDNPGDLRHRFLRNGDAFTLEYAWGTSGEQVVPIGSCRFHDRGAVTRMECGAVEALLADGVPILVSFPDYNTAGVDVVTRFVHGGQTHLVVRLALKVQTVYGLLFRSAGGGWQALFHPRNYSLLC